MIYNDDQRMRGRFRQLAADSPIAIIGGSLVGPALAVLLERAGFTNVHIYEAMRRIPTVGGVLGLDTYSLGVLASIGIEQDEIVPFPNQRVERVTLVNRRETERGITEFPGRNTTRPLLHRALTKRLPMGRLHTGKRLTAVSCGDDGGALLDFEDGTQVTSCMTGFADGRRSLGRRLFDPDRSLRYAGFVGHRGQLDDCPDDQRHFMLYRTTGMQLEIFPIRLPDGRIGRDWTLYENVNAATFRRRFGASPTDRTFVFSHQISKAGRDALDAAVTRKLPEAIAALIHRTDERMVAPIVDIAPPKWLVTDVGDSAAVLFGDAAAPVFPQTGRGLNNGIDQAHALADALARYLKDGTDLGVALDSWQTPYVGYVADALQEGPQLVGKFGLGRP